MYLFFFSLICTACQFEYEVTPSFWLVSDIALLLQSGGPNRNCIQNTLSVLDALFKEKQKTELTKKRTKTK